MISWILIMVGALNWGLVGLGAFMGNDWNVVGMLLGASPTLEWLVYVLVGVAALYEIVTRRNA